MTYYDDRLQKLQQDVARKKRAEAELSELREQINILAENERKLKKIKLAEQADVDRLEGRSLAAFFYNVVGNKDEKLDKERREAYAASVKYDAAARELEGAEADTRRLVEELRELEGCEERYDETLRAKAEEVKASGSAAAREILELESEIAFLENQKREIGEAITAGQDAMHTAGKVMNSLDSAEGWGTWDLLGGGIITDIVKHSHLDEAQGQVEHLQGKLRRFKTELADVQIQADMQISIDGFLRFADYFFDGLFADWAVMDKIGRSKSQVRDTLGEINSVIARLTALRSDVDARQTEKREKLAQLVTNA